MSSTYFKLPSVTHQAYESIYVFNGADALEPELQVALLTLLLSRLQKKPATPLLAVEATLACFSCAIPGLAAQLSQMKSLNVVSHTVTLSDLEDYSAGMVPKPGSLGSILSTMPAILDAVSNTDTLGVYAAVSSLIMAIGKQGGTGPDAASLGSRPLALVNKYLIPTLGQVSLPGRLYGPSKDCLDMVYNSFANYTEPRMILVQYFLALSQQVGHLPQNMDVLMTNFRLIRGAGMTHVDAINKFLQMHPWTLRVPELKPYYTKYAKELIEFQKIPAEIRSYHRLLVPQSDFFFLTSEYRPLTAVAASFLKDVEVTFAGYVANETDYATLVAKVRRYQPSTSKYQGAGELAARLGVQDMDLPEIDDKPPNIMLPSA